jgi:predicted acylesterase/phospholipase RssA
VRFGSEGRDHIPISKAVQASTALPGMYPPVEIEGHSYVDGALQRTLHASVALDAGADLVLCINPIVPYDARLAEHGSPPEYGSLVRGGAPSVMSQTFKALIHSRMKVGMAKYDTQYETADVILFEPDRDDVKMFFANVFSFANRRRVCEHAYQTTRRDLLARREQLGPIFARHGVRMRTDILADPNRTFSTSLEMGAARHGRRRAAVTAGLSRALDNLEQMLEGADLPGDLIHY